MPNSDSQPRLLSAANRRKRTRKLSKPQKRQQPLDSRDREQEWRPGACEDTCCLQPTLQETPNVGSVDVASCGTTGVCGDTTEPRYVQSERLLSDTEHRLDVIKKESTPEFIVDQWYDLGPSPHKYAYSPASPEPMSTEKVEMKDTTADGCAEHSQPKLEYRASSRAPSGETFDSVNGRVPSGETFDSVNGRVPSGETFDSVNGRVQSGDTFDSVNGMQLPNSPQISHSADRESAPGSTQAAKGKASNKVIHRADPNGATPMSMLPPFLGCPLTGNSFILPPNHFPLSVHAAAPYFHVAATPNPPASETAGSNSGVAGGHRRSCLPSLSVVKPDINYPHVRSEIGTSALNQGSQSYSAYTKTDQMLTTSSAMSCPVSLSSLPPNSTHFHSSAVAGHFFAPRYTGCQTALEYQEFLYPHGVYHSNSFPSPGVVLVPSHPYYVQQMPFIPLIQAVNCNHLHVPRCSPSLNTGPHDSGPPEADRDLTTPTGNSATSLPRTANPVTTSTPLMENNQPRWKEKQAADSGPASSPRARVKVQTKIASSADFIDPTKLKFGVDDVDTEDDLSQLNDGSDCSDKEWHPSKRDLKSRCRRDSESGNGCTPKEDGHIQLDNSVNKTCSRRRQRSSRELAECNECGKVFKGSYYLRRHQMSHSDIRPFQCSTCHKCFKQKAHLIGHQSVHERALKLHVADGKSPSPKPKPSLMGSKCPGRPKKAYSEKDRACKECGKVFKTVYRLKRHELSHTDVRPFSCRICGKAFKQTGHRNEHEANHENTKKRFLCNMCGVVFRCRSSFNNHMRSHGTEKLRIQPTRSHLDGAGVENKQENQEVCHSGYDCPYCTEKFATAQALNSHLETHVEVQQRRHVQPYSCDVCRRAFTYRHNLIKHKLIHKAPDKFAQFYKEKFEAHLASGKPSFKCTKCAKVFIRKETLAKHCKIHTGSKPFKCAICSHEFTQNVHLKVHMRKHTGSRPFQCKECSKSFIDSTALAKHVEYEACNTDNSLYRCKLCHKMHYYLGSLKKHIRKRHSANEEDVDQYIIKSERSVKRRGTAEAEKYPCQVCSSSFSEKCNLVRHIKRKHAILVELLQKELEGQHAKVAADREITRDPMPKDDGWDSDKKLAVVTERPWLPCYVPATDVAVSREAATNQRDVASPGELVAENRPCAELNTLDEAASSELPAEGRTVTAKTLEAPPPNIRFTATTEPANSSVRPTAMCEDADHTIDRHSRSAEDDQASSLVKRHSRSAEDDQASSLVKRHSRSAEDDQASSLVKRHSRSAEDDQASSLVKRHSRSAEDDQASSLVKRHSRSAEDDQASSLVKRHSRSAEDDQASSLVKRKEEGEPTDGFLEGFQSRDLVFSDRQLGQQCAHKLLVCKNPGRSNVQGNNCPPPETPNVQPGELATSANKVNIEEETSSPTDIHFLYTIGLVVSSKGRAPGDPVVKPSWNHRDEWNCNPFMSVCKSLTRPGNSGLCSDHPKPHSQLDRKECQSPTPKPPCNRSLSFLDSACNFREDALVTTDDSCSLGCSSESKQDSNLSPSGDSCDETMASCEMYGTKHNLHVVESHPSEAEHPGSEAKHHPSDVVHPNETEHRPIEAEHNRTEAEHHHSEVEHSSQSEHHHSEVEHSSQSEHHHSEVELSSQSEHHHSEVEHSSQSEHHHSEVEHSSQSEHHHSEVEHSSQSEHHHSEVEQSSQSEHHHIEVEHSSQSEHHHSKVEYSSQSEHHHSEVEHDPSDVDGHPSQVAHHPSAVEHHANLVEHQASRAEHYHIEREHDPSEGEHDPSEVAYPNEVEHRGSEVIYLRAVQHQASRLEHHHNEREHRPIATEHNSIESEHHPIEIEKSPIEAEPHPSEVEHSSQKEHHNSGAERHPIHVEHPSQEGHHFTEAQHHPCDEEHHSSEAERYPSELELSPLTCKHHCQNIFTGCALESDKTFTGHRTAKCDNQKRICMTNGQNMRTSETSVLRRLETGESACLPADRPSWTKLDGEDAHPQLNNTLGDTDVAADSVCTLSINTSRITPAAPRMPREQGHGDGPKLKGMPREQGHGDVPKLQGMPRERGHGDVPKLQGMPRERGHGDGPKLKGMPREQGHGDGPKLQDVPREWGHGDDPKLQGMPREQGHGDGPRLQGMPREQGHGGDPKLQGMPREWGHGDGPKLQGMPRERGHGDGPKLQGMPRERGHGDGPKLQGMSRERGHGDGPKLQCMPRERGHGDGPKLQGMPREWGHGDDPKLQGMAQCAAPAGRINTAPSISVLLQSDSERSHVRMVPPDLGFNVRTSHFLGQQTGLCVVTSVEAVTSDSGTVPTGACSIRHPSVSPSDRTAEASRNDTKPYDQINTEGDILSKKRKLVDSCSLTNVATKDEIQGSSEYVPCHDVSYPAHPRVHSTSLSRSIDSHVWSVDSSKNDYEACPTESHLKYLGLLACKDAHEVKNKSTPIKDLYLKYKPWLEEVVRSTRPRRSRFGYKWGTATRGMKNSGSATTVAEQLTYIRRTFDSKDKKRKPRKASMCGNASSSMEAVVTQRVILGDASAIKPKWTVVQNHLQEINTDAEKTQEPSWQASAESGSRDSEIVLTSGHTPRSLSPVVRQLVTAPSPLATPSTADSQQDVQLCTLPATAAGGSEPVSGCAESSSPPSTPDCTLKGKQVYVCLVCNKYFTARHQLKRHALTHTDHRPYTCEKCGRAFRQKVHLSDHTKRHQGQRPFVCAGCGKRFVLKNEMNQHIKNHCRGSLDVFKSVSFVSDKRTFHVAMKDPNPLPDAGESATPANVQSQDCMLMIGQCYRAGDIISNGTITLKVIESACSQAQEKRDSSVPSINITPPLAAPASSQPPDCHTSSNGGEPTDRPRQGSQGHPENEVRGENMEL